VGSFVVVLVACGSLTADSVAVVKSKTLTVLGTLTDEMPVGANVDIWSLQLNPVIMVDGRQISSLEVKSSDNHKLEALADKFVQARGRLTLVTGVENAEPPVFELWSIKEHKSKRRGRFLLWVFVAAAF
jgi:hypothetical protein